MSRILVYSHDTYGLGNIRRMLAIATYLVGTVDEASVLMVSGSPMVQGFRIAPGIDYIKLPSVTRTVRDGYAPRSLDLDADGTFEFRANLILAAVADFRPDVILVDKKPFGVENELEGALHYVRATLPATAVVLVLRDILDEPAATIRTWTAGRYSATIDRFYDLVLVLGSRAVFDPCREYQLPLSVRAKTRFCGYVRRLPGLRRPHEVRRELGVPAGGRLVVVTTGGGQDGLRILETYVAALPTIHGDGDVHSLIITGPELEATDRDRLHGAAAGHPGSIVREFTDDMMSCLEAADAVVCMAGYNTVCEVASVEAPAVLVPRVRPVEEQWLRAERLARLGLMRVLHPDALTPEALAISVRQLLDAPRPSTRAVMDLGALPRIARHVEALLRRQRDRATPAAVARRHQPAPPAFQRVN